MMKRDETMRTVNHLVILAALSVPLYTGVVAASDSAAPVDTSEWLCEDCPFEEGFSGNVEIGVGAVSKDSFKYGEYNGLNEEGGFLLGNARVRYRDKNANYMDLSITDAGLDSRSFGIEGGRQGSYELWLLYDQIPHFISDTAQTVFTGSGSDVLSLPGGWTRGGTTAGMTSLGTSLRQVDLETERKRLVLGGAVMPGSRWKFEVNERHETKEGAIAGAASFFTNSAQFVRPVDYVTDEVDVSAAYTGEKWQARLAYYASLFRNQDESLRWQNPFTPIFAGEDNGQLALPPDNQSHQVVFAAGYQVNERTHASGELALGRMTQDESFLPATVNTSFASPALPRTSLDGQVDTLNANFRVISAVTDKLRLNAAYAYNDRDNKTPQADYTWVTTDSVLNGSTRTNLPYSFTRNTIQLGGDYRAPHRTKLSGGLKYETQERDYQEVDKTKETTLWVKANVRQNNLPDLTLKGSHANRDASSYGIVPEIDGPQNPLLRKFYMADRTRNMIGVYAGMPAHERVNIGLGFDYARDDYTNSSVGLTDSRELSLSGDASVSLAENTTLTLFLVHEQIDSTQAGAGWTADNNDRINTAGVGLKHQALEGKLDLGADLSATRSRGEILMNFGGSQLPDLTTRLSSLKLYADYRFKEDITLHAALWHENYDGDDWGLDNVDEDTISNVLSLGQASPSYSVNAISLSARYRF